MISTSTAAARLSGGVFAGAVGKAFAAALVTPFGAVAACVRHVRREMEIARARRQMAELSDAMLKDIGIDRVDIDLAARFGRREHGRRYL